MLTISVVEAKRNNKGKQVQYNGYVFTRDETRGYYLSAKPINGKRKYLHRYVWMCNHQRKVPDGHVVHHKDSNKENNEIGNLVLVEKSVHTSKHSKEYYSDPDNYAYWRQKFEPVRQKGTDTYKDPKYHAKRKEISKKAWEEKSKSIIICQECGKEKETYYPGRTIFCSKICSNRHYRRKFKEEHGISYDAYIRPRSKGKVVKWQKS